MGYSCTDMADDVLRQWFATCKETTGVGNSYLHNGNRYCLQIGREQYDGAITGKVMLLVPNGHEQYLAYNKGTFRIESDGTVKRWPIGLRTLVGEQQ